MKVPLSQRSIPNYEALYWSTWHIHMFKIYLKCPYYGFLKITFMLMNQLISSRFMLTSTWNISILPTHLLRAQTWENLIFTLVWIKMLIHSLPLGAVKNSCFPGDGCTQSSTALTNTALNEIDQSNQSPQISITQRRGLEKLIVDRIVWESLRK